MSIQDQIRFYEKTIAEATRTLEVLKQLPANLDVTHCFCSHGQWHIVLATGLKDALKHLKPLAIEVRRDPFNEPRATVLSRVAQDGDICFPVGVAQDGSSFWFSVLPDGNQVKVKVTSDDTPLVISNGYEPVLGHHQHFYRRTTLFPNKVPAANVLEDEQDAAKRAAAKLQELFDGVLAKIANRPRSDVLSKMLSAELGYPVTVSHRGIHTVGFDELLYEYWATVGKWHEHASVRVSAEFDPNGFDFEYPAGAAYADVGPLFAD